MRYFRIPSFTGIEGHRNKPDRGSMRAVEGCMVSPSGSMRSGHVWSKYTGYKLTYPDPAGDIASIADYSGTEAGTVLVTTTAAHGLQSTWKVVISETTDYNAEYTVTVVNSTTFYVTATWVNSQTGEFVDAVAQYCSRAADTSGNDFLFVSSQTGQRATDLAFIPKPGYSDAGAEVTTTVGILASAGTVLKQVIGDDDAYLSPIGRNYALGNGLADPVFVTSSYLPGPAIATSTDFYQLGRNAFPKCRFFVVGPNKCLYAAGSTADAEEKLTIYISEPTGVSDKDRDSLYAGATSSVSKVKILLTNATTVTALSVLGPYVVVHTDAGITLLYGTNTKQAATGFRVEQVDSPVTTAAMSPRCVSGNGRSHPFFVGMDGQIWKDESATAGPYGKPAYSDPRQVSWKAKGLWSKSVGLVISAEDHTRMDSHAFTTYDPSSGMFYMYGVCNGLAALPV